MLLNFKQQLLECFRYIFTLEDKDVMAPAFDYFCECLEALVETTSNNGVEFHYKEIPVDFPQYFTYNRNKELVGFLIIFDSSNHILTYLKKISMQFIIASRRLFVHSTSTQGSRMDTKPMTCEM